MNLPSKSSLVISLSGPHGCGKSTNGKFLAEKLELQYISAGSVFRQLAKEKNLTLEQMSKLAEENHDIDHEIDKRMLQLADQGGVILDGSLTGWVLGDKADLKILITAPFKIRVQRIATRDGTTIDHATNETKIRETSEKQRFKDIYDIDIADYSIFDLIINNEKYNINATNQILLTAIVEYLKQNKP